MKYSQVTAILSVLWYIAATQSKDWAAVASMALFAVYGLVSLGFTFLERRV